MYVGIQKACCKSMYLQLRKRCVGLKGLQQAKGYFSQKVCRYERCVASNQIVYLLKRCVELNAAKQVKVCIRLKGV